jgi:hypothetical protein
LNIQNPYFYINDSNIHGKGIFIKGNVPINTKLFLSADLDRRDKRLSWITDLAKFINHQKNGNCELIQEGNKFFLCSIRDIIANEELTCDYTLLKYPFINVVDGYKELD